MLKIFQNVCSKTPFKNLINLPNFGNHILQRIYHEVPSSSKSESHTCLNFPNLAWIEVHDDDVRSLASCWQVWTLLICHSRRS